MFLIPKILGSIQFLIRMFPLILNGRRITGLATTHIHLMPGSRISGALCTILRSDAATEAKFLQDFRVLWSSCALKLTTMHFQKQRFNLDTNILNFFGNPWNRFRYGTQFWTIKLNLII
jgi:hypothetical protein